MKSENHFQISTAAGTSPVLTGEPVRTLDFIDDLKHSIGEPIDKSV
jgi:hypothetical protein